MTVSKMKISTGLNLHVCSRDNMVEYIRQGLQVHRSIGFDAVDFSHELLEGIGGDVAAFAEQVRAVAAETGVDVGVGHLPYGLSANASPEGVAAFNRRVHDAIDAMALLGIRYAVVHPNTWTERAIQFDHQARYDAVMRHLSPFVEHAGRVGLGILVENMREVHQSCAVHRYCGTPEELCRLADALGAGVCWDTGHGHINGLRQSEALQYVGSRLKLVHLNDNYGEDDIHLAPFMGTIDWADVMRGLRAVKYDGPLNFELRAPGNTPEVRRAFGMYVYAAAQDLLGMMESE